MTRDQIKSDYILRPKRLVSPECWCEFCDMAANNGWRSRMSLCPECGDKRCARALTHDAPCSKSEG